MQNKSIGPVVHAALIGALSLGLSGPVFAGSFFGPIPANIRSANAGTQVSIGTLSQQYAETINGKTLDAESGSIPTYTLGTSTQGAHLGFALNMRYTKGSDAYNGALQNLTTGATTPYQTTTDNRMVDANFAVRLGFSPTKNLAIIPEALIGTHVWDRNLQGPYGIDEVYTNRYTAFGSSVDYRIDSFVLSGNYLSGSTSSASMTTNLSGVGPFNLGNHSWSRYGARITWLATSEVRVFLAYNKTKFGYGKSAVDSAGYLEPDSTSAQASTYLGVMLF